MGTGGYSNEINILRRQVEALEKQVVTLSSIDTKVTGVSSNDEQLNQTDNLTLLVSLQQDQLDVSREIYKLIKEIGNFF